MSAKAWRNRRRRARRLAVLRPVYRWHVLELQFKRYTWEERRTRTEWLRISGERLP